MRTEEWEIPQKCIESVVTIRINKETFSPLLKMATNRTIDSQDSRRLDKITKIFLFCSNGGIVDNLDHNIRI